MKALILIILMILGSRCSVMAITALEAQELANNYDIMSEAYAAIKLAAEAGKIVCVIKFPANSRSNADYVCERLKTDGFHIEEIGIWSIEVSWR